MAAAPATAVMVDNVTVGPNYEGDTATLSYTPVAGDDRILVVGFAGERGQAHPETATYGGQPLTEAKWRTKGLVFSGLWYMLLGDDAAPTAADIVMSPGAAPSSRRGYAIIAFTLTGAAQQAPEATASGASDASTLSTDITTLTDGAAVVDVYTHGYQRKDTWPTGALQSQLAEPDNSAAAIGVSWGEVASAGTATFGWQTNAQSKDQAHTLAAFAPAAEPAAVIPEPLTMLAVVGGLGALGGYVRRRRS
jgi:hypothetical protein